MMAVMAVTVNEGQCCHLGVAVEAGKAAGEVLRGVTAVEVAIVLTVLGCSNCAICPIRCTPSRCSGCAGSP